MAKMRDLEEGSLFQKKYRIGKKLGEGGMGVVYAAVQEPSGLPVAIKLVFAKEVNVQNLAGERALREARALAKLNHNNLVRLIDADKTPEGDYYIVMELVEGETLRAIIERARRHGRFGDPQHTGRMLHIMAQVAEGMATAHKAGIIHRDIKPDNVIVSAGGLARLVDFGLAKNPEGGAPLLGGVETNPANIAGTPRYMAPEQVCGREIDARTDIYGFGVTGYEAITGRSPIEREGDVLGVTEIMGRHCYAEPTPISEHVPTCPQRVAEIILRCLAKEQSARFQDARALAREIRLVLAEEVDEKGGSAERSHGGNMAPKELAARETAPMPQHWTPGMVLPFVAPAQPAAHVVRETAPMPPPEAVRPPQPTYAAAQPTAQRGVGFTTKMPRPSAAQIDAAEAELANARFQFDGPTSPGTLAVVATEAVSNGEQCAAADQAATSSGTTSGIHRRQLPAAPVCESTQTGEPLDRTSEPHPMQKRVAAMPVPNKKTARFGVRVPPLYFAPIGGSIIAGLLLLALMESRGGSHAGVAPQTTTVVPTAPPSSTQPPSSSTPSAVASSQASASAAAETTTVAPNVEPISMPQVATAVPVIATSAPTAVNVSMKPTPKPTATSSAPLGPESPGGSAPRRTGKRPITPPPWPADEASSRPTRRPITPPPRPEAQDAKPSARIFGVEQ
jgi:serine/threonine-protein kinase